MEDLIFRGSLADYDQDVFELAEIEAERQYRKLILIPSESLTPAPVRQALATAFHNIYAEGYPAEETRWMTEEEILDYPERLAHYHRYSDPRYYKGVEYAGIIEALARRRCAQLFATKDVTADDLYVNVQPLSGAPANNAVYLALASPGDIVMGMSLFHGGHLTHGSPVNRSGKLYKIIHYTVDPETERLNYDRIIELADQYKPKIIIAGYSSYPWAVDWAKFRQAADAAGAYLFADIAHVAGMVAAGAYPSPVGYADVITFTTHKTLCGPRGACILTNNEEIASKIDKAVFPGEQGGPHVHVFAALAVAFKLATSRQFHDLQHQIVTNAKVLTERLRQRGMRIAYGGTDTHLMNLDVKSVRGADGTPLSGERAARILDMAGIVVNRNTIPGDSDAFNSTGIRMGTPWVTQRGFKEAEMTELADIIADVLKATKPYFQPCYRNDKYRAKVSFAALEDARRRVRHLAESAASDPMPERGLHRYPHFYFSDDKVNGATWKALEISGERARHFLSLVLTSDVEILKPGEKQATRLILPQGAIDGTLACLSTTSFRLSLPADKVNLVATWMRDMTDGYVIVDENDLLRKITGPVAVKDSDTVADPKIEGNPIAEYKPYYIGISGGSGKPLPKFVWEEKEPTELKRTSLYDLHCELGAKMVPFAGWEMPVWYTSVKEEHAAVRQTAGLFDVSHMGVYQAEGPDARAFLDSVCAGDIGNEVGGLLIGESTYTHLLDPDANVIDDLLVYRRDYEKYLIVVNAANDDKDWAWLNAVKDGTVCIDNERPWAKAFGRGVRLRNLRDPKEGADMRVDIALQGPRSRDILLSLGCNEADRKKIMKLKRTQLCEARVGGFDLVVSRTGYTGEKVAFELFVHPEKAPDLFRALLKAGEAYGIKPCGLGARDSTRTEAGLPLYGHEFAGPLNLSVGDGGFDNFVRVYKAWFIGRSAYIAREKARKGGVVRFRFLEKGVRMAHQGDPVLDKRGKTIGYVTSCAIDQEGFLTGMAYLDLANQAEGTPIYIFQSAPQEANKAPAELQPGDKNTLPTPAVVIKRFPD